MDILPIRIIDTTLRDGEQAPGICFPPEIKVELLKMLYEVGIRDFEIGSPAVSEDEQEAIRRMFALGLNANLSVWCRAQIDDLKIAASLGAKQINLSLPVSDIQLNAIGKDKNWVFSQLKSCLEFASCNFNFVTIGAQDASRTNACMLKDYINFSISSPVVKRIRIADTVGIMNPFTVHDMVGKMVEEFPTVEFEFHGHNDLGMATANTLAAIVAGATRVSATINGLGERSGNAPLEEVVLALEYSWSTPTALNKNLLQGVCNLVSTLTGRKTPLAKPFSGELSFTHESGIHTRSLIIDQLAYQPFRPEEIGRTMRFIYGKHSGKSAIQALLTEKKLYCSNQIVCFILNEIKSTTHFSSIGYAEEDVLDIYHRKFSQGVENCNTLGAINDIRIF
jgi:homocitrate synthase NifV